MFLYQFYSINDMKMLNQIADKNNIRTLIIGHSSFLSWIYNKDFNFFNSIEIEYNTINNIVIIIIIFNIISRNKNRTKFRG